tara:strand:+ start:133 stop:246 length:114 start_codon:yes stop_codon:yes gene_type:complete
MKALYIHLTDEEHEKLSKHKEELGLNWHDYLVRSLNG